MASTKKDTHITNLAALEKAANGEIVTLPGWTVGTAGESAWLTGILAFPPFLLLGWMVFSLCRRSGGREA